MKTETIEPGIASLRISTDESPYLDGSTVARLALAVDKLARDDSLHAGLVEGGSQYFSAGADREALLMSDGRTEVAHFCAEVPALLLKIPVPTVAAMVGHGIGGGLVLGLWCDVAVLAMESLYGVNFMELGFTPGMGSTGLLPEAMGAPLARELMYSGRLLKGRELKACGGPLAHAIVPRAEVRARALATARDMVGVSRQALVLLKSALSKRRHDLLQDALRVEQPMRANLFDDESVKMRIAERYGKGSGTGGGSTDASD